MTGRRGSGGTEGTGQSQGGWAWEPPVPLGCPALGTQARLSRFGGPEKTASDLNQHVTDVHVAGLRRSVQGRALVLVLHLEVGVDPINCKQTGGASYRRCSPQSPRWRKGWRGSRRNRQAGLWSETPSTCAPPRHPHLTLGSPVSPVPRPGPEREGGGAPGWMLHREQDPQARPTGKAVAEHSSQPGVETGYKANHGAARRTRHRTRSTRKMIKIAISVNIK